MAGEIENEARRRADEITAQAELAAAELDRDSRERAEARVAQATAERDRIWEQIRIGVGRATKQVGDLLRIREELLLDLKGAMSDSRDALNRLEEGGGEPAVEAAPPAWLPEPGELPPAPPATAPQAPPPIAGQASEVARRGSPLSPGLVAAPAPAAPPAPSLTSLRAGPFESFLAVMRFERALAALPAVDAVYVRRFSNGEVDVEIEAANSSRLAEELRGMDGVNTVKAEGGLLRVAMLAETPE